MKPMKYNMLSDLYNLCLFIVIFYVILLVIDHLLKYWLFSVHASAGVTVQFLQIKWFTTSFNRCLQKLGTWRSQFQKAWFTTGMWLTLFSLPIAISLVIQSTYALFFNLMWKESKHEQTTTPFLQAAVPGVNIPISDVGYYVTTLLICSVFHELGHTTAAVREGLHITGVGIVILFIIPVAYVHIEGLENLSPSKQLRILCAGIWHNIILACVASVILLFLPWLCYPFYDYGNGIQVISIHENSPLQEEGGLNINDVILRINKCGVFNHETWIKCIYQVHAKNPALGYCVPSEFIHENDESIQVKQLFNVVQCCNNETLSKICFEYLGKGGNPLELPQYSCLKARLVIEQSKSNCYSLEDCLGLHCLRPSLPNGTKLIEIQRKDLTSVLFLGNPTEVFHDIHISEYIKISYLPVWIPNSSSKLCNFFIMFSGAFATLNLIPCFRFDGQHIIRVLINTSVVRNIRFKSAILDISYLITVLGSCILVIYTILMFLSIFL